jgi:hypothetical protein
VDAFNQVALVQLFLTTFSAGLCTCNAVVDP